MTAQIPDTVVFRGKAHALVGMKEKGRLFMPGNYGIAPRMIHTACWRGYIAQYKCANDTLLLDTLEINVEGESPAINGVLPEPKNKVVVEGWHVEKYTGLNLAMPYTGTLIIATDFIRNLYVHMGIQAAWKYETVWELSFEDGQLTAAVDASEKWAAVREEEKR